MAGVAVLSRVAVVHNAGCPRMMRRWGVSVVVLWVLAGFLSGCGSGETLPRVRYGEDMCANCRMIINDPQYACVVETADRGGSERAPGELMPAS